MRTIVTLFFLSLVVGCGFTSYVDAGPQKKTADKMDAVRAISFGLYGSVKKYTEGALRNADLALDVYPGWKVYYYIDSSSVPADIVNKLKAKPNVVVRESSDFGNPFSRFLIADDPEVDRFIVRDVDSRLNLREKAAVEEWIQTDFSVHDMRDHPYHSYVMMAGMWGAKKGFLNGHKMEDLIATYGVQGTYGHDQNFLEYLVVNHIGWRNVLVHDSYRCKDFLNGFSFPTPREGTQFVGQIVDFGSDGTEVYLQEATSEPCERKQS